MPFLNANTPHFKAWVRSEFLYNMESHVGELTRCYVFGVQSVHGRALGFHIMTDRGAQVHALPIHSLVLKQDAPRLPLDYLQLWDCFDYDLSVTSFDYLAGLRCSVLLKDRQWYDGQYLFTLDWCHASTDYVDTGYAEEPSEHKCAHLIALDNGCLAAQPNNRIQWYEPSFVSKPFKDSGQRPDYKVNQHTWRSETSGTVWSTENSDRMFYDTVQSEQDEGGEPKPTR